MEDRTDNDKRIHRLLMEKPMSSDRNIAKLTDCAVKDVARIRQGIWTRC